MTLQIRDARAKKLARDLAAHRHTTMTKVVLQALENEMAGLNEGLSFDRRNAEVMAMADAMGTSQPTFNMKTFSDEMWAE